jgi:hypothetical protein
MRVDAGAVFGDPTPTPGAHSAPTSARPPRISMAAGASPYTVAAHAMGRSALAAACPYLHGATAVHRYAVLLPLVVRPQRSRSVVRERSSDREIMRVIRSYPVFWLRRGARSAHLHPRGVNDSQDQCDRESGGWGTGLFAHPELLAHRGDRRPQALKPLAFLNFPRDLLLP